MNIKELIFKPKWLSRDAAVRRKAVSSERDPRLLSKLTEYAREDPDAGVRLAAASRIDDLGTLGELTAHEDRAIRALAERRVRNLLAADTTEGVAVEQRVAWLNDQPNRDRDEYLATDAASSAVRKAVIARLDRPGVLGKIAINDADPALRRVAIDRIQQRSTLERVAKAVRGKDKSLYRAISERLEAQDLAAGNRVAIAERARAIIEETEQMLVRQERGEQSQQRLTQLEAEWKSSLAVVEVALTERFGRNVEQLRAEPTAQDQPAVPGRRAIAAAERALAEHGADIETLEATRDGLLALAEDDDLTKADRQRCRDLAARARQQFDALQLAEELAPLRKITAEAKAKVASSRASAKSITKLESRWQRAWQSRFDSTPEGAALAREFQLAKAEIGRQLESQRDAQDAAADALPGQLEAWKEAVEANDLAAARDRQSTFDRMVKAAGRHPTTRDVNITAEAASLRGKMHELRDWQRWANDEIRQRLIDRAKELAGSGVHPDAVMSKLRELRQRWRDLQQSERLSNDDKPPLAPAKLWRAFNEACDEAAKPTKDFFAKRGEVRERKAAELEALVTAMKAMPGEAPDYGKIEAAMRDGFRSMKQLGEVDPRARSELAKQLKEEATRLKRILNDNHEVVAARKRRLIDQAQALDGNQLTDHIEQAKQLQRDWQRCGRLPRKQDQALWREFRAPIDALFAQLDEQHAEKRAAVQSVNAEGQALIDELNALDVEQAAGNAITSYRSRWHDIGVTDRQLQGAFEQAMDTLEASLDQRQQRAATAARERHFMLAKAMVAGDASAIEQARTGISLTDELAARVAGMMQGAMPPGDAAAARAACIAMEYLAGVDTPDEDAQARLDYQVNRLAERMAGADQLAPGDEALALIHQLACSGPLAAGEQHLAERFAKALAAFSAQR